MLKLSTHMSQLKIDDDTMLGWFTGTYGRLLANVHSHFERMQMITELRKLIANHPENPRLSDTACDLLEKQEHWIQALEQRCSALKTLNTWTTIVLSLTSIALGLFSVFHKS